MIESSDIFILLNRLFRFLTLGFPVTAPILFPWLAVEKCGIIHCNACTSNIASASMQTKKSPFEANNPACNALAFPRFFSH